MLFLLCIVLYCALAGASMFGLCYLNKAYDAIDSFDFPTASIIASLFFPIGFPLAAAYIIGTGSLTSEED